MFFNSSYYYHAISTVYMKSLHFQGILLEYSIIDSPINSCTYSLNRGPNETYGSFVNYNNYLCGFAISRFVG